MGCGAAEATGLGFVCFVVINPRVLSTDRVDFGLFFVNFVRFTPPPSFRCEDVCWKSSINWSNPGLRKSLHYSHGGVGGGGLVRLSFNLL